MLDQLHEECGVAALYHLSGTETSPLVSEQSQVSRLMPRMLQDLQNRGQLAAGMTTYNPERNQLIDTHKDVGNVSEVFRTNQKKKMLGILERYDGPAAIGHVRYATCGQNERSYAQPFERHHIKKHKWFSFVFNGQLANYGDLHNKLLLNPDNHLARETDTEVFMHEISAALKGDKQPPVEEICAKMAKEFDGAWSFIYLDALGTLFVARDPHGIKPLCYAMEGPLFAAASESVALVNLGFSPESVKPVPPGSVVGIQHNTFFEKRFVEESFFNELNTRSAHCFFEWVYFSNVASNLDGSSVYLSRKRSGEELARSEFLDLDKSKIETIVAPVPDTSKAAADAYAYELGLPCLEGIIRNRYSGRTFIEGDDSRVSKVMSKFTPVPEVLEGKRVILVEDSIVRGTTLRVLIERIRNVGRPKEIHIRVACPPIIAPCFYGIDMSTYNQLLAPEFYKGKREVTDEIEKQIAKRLGADTVHYLPVESIPTAIQKPAEDLCMACINGKYPTPWGQKMADIALEKFEKNIDAGRTYDIG